MGYLNEYEVVDRLTPLATLSGKKGIFDKHNMVETMLRPSPYIPTLGIELELVADRYRRYMMPWKEIETVIAAGMKRGSDGMREDWPVNYSYKEELDLRPVQGTHITHAQEISLLKELGILNLKKTKSNYSKSFYPIHINIGIKPDFPVWEKMFNINPNEKISIEDWEYLRIRENSPIIKKTLQLSDCYLLARALDSTLWGTSVNRLTHPFNNHQSGYPLAGFAAKGWSGVNSRSIVETQFNEAVVEFRTAELWTLDGLRDFQRYIKTFLIIGAAAKSYLKLPVRERDIVLKAELENDVDTQIETIIGYEKFKEPHDAELALAWTDFRRSYLRLFRENGLSNPMLQYRKQEFNKFANALKINKSNSLANESRKIITKHRGIIGRIINI